MAKPFRVVIAVFPEVTQLDFTAPYEVFVRLPGAQCVIASVAGEPLTSDGGLQFGGVARLADIPECALLCVPGGHGVDAAMEDPALLAQLRRLADSARHVAAPCTGSLLLGAAGLLVGRRAGCHWAWRDQLEAFGAIPDPARTVRDGKFFTSGGVTAGLDMALTVAAEVAGEAHARTVQLLLEYAPEPPFQSGRPELAGPDIVARADAFVDAHRARRRAAIARAAAAMPRTAPM